MDRITVHDDYASSYDNEAEGTQWIASDILMGMCLEFLKPGQKLFDIGIGTGLGSISFHKQGIEVSGLDGSKAMLEECRKKEFAAKLVHHDVEKLPWPIKDNFDIMLSAGVFHFFENLELFFEEAKRMVNPEGLFCFTAMRCLSKDYQKFKDANFLQSRIDGAPVPVFVHSTSYIDQLSGRFGFKRLKKIAFLMENTSDGNFGDIIFDAYLLKKKGDI